MFRCFFEHFDTKYFYKRIKNPKTLHVSFARKGLFLFLRIFLRFPVVSFRRQRDFQRKKNENLARSSSFTSCFGQTLSAYRYNFWWPKLTEAIQRKCNNCIPCKLSGKNIKPNIPKSKQNSLPPLSAPNEEIQLDFIGPITEQNRRFYILLSIDRYSKWPGASRCKTTDGETAMNFLKQYCDINGVPKS